MGQREGELRPGCSCHWATTEGTSFRSVLEAESCPLRHPETQAPRATHVPAPPETVAFSSKRDDMWPRTHTAALLLGRSLHFSQRVGSLRIPWPMQAHPKPGGACGAGQGVWDEDNLA